jgi:Ca2+:H+ antiporter
MFEPSLEKNEVKVGEEEEGEAPQLTVRAAIVLLVVVTVLVAFTAEFLVGSIDGLAETWGIKKEFIGLILLPIVGNAAEHATAVTVAVKDKLTLSISVAVGSSIVS